MSVPGVKSIKNRIATFFIAHFINSTEMFRVVQKTVLVAYPIVVSDKAYFLNSVDWTIGGHWNPRFLRRFAISDVGSFKEVIKVSVCIGSGPIKAAVPKPSHPPPAKPVA